LKLAAPALAAILATTAVAQPGAPIHGWSVKPDGTYVHDATGMPCPKTFGWVKRVQVSSIVRGPVVARCTYVGGETAEVRIRRFDPTAARDAKALRNERNLMSQRGDSRSPFGYFTRWEEPVIGGKPIQVERYTMKRAGMLIDCDTKFTGPPRGDVILSFDGLCRSLQPR